MSSQTHTALPGGQPHAGTIPFAARLGAWVTALLVALAALVIALLLAPVSRQLQESVPYAYAYGSLHMLAQVPSVIVASLILVLGWNAKGKDTPNSIVVLSIGFCAIGALGLADALSDAGMPALFTTNTAEKNLDFRLAGRLTTALVLLCAGLAARLPWSLQSYRQQLLASTLAVVGATIWAVLGAPGLLPSTWTSEAGPTSFARGLQVIALAINVTAAFAFNIGLPVQRERYSRYLAAGSCVVVLSGLFCFVSDATGAYHLIGDLYGFIAYLLIYRAVFANSIDEPYRRLEQASRDLEFSNQRFRSLTELSSDWYWELDGEFRFTISTGLTSAAPQLLFGEAVAGKARWELPNYIGMTPAIWQAHRSQLEAHLPFKDFDLTRRGPDGVVRHLSISGEPMFAPDGSFTGYRGVGKDLTARRQSEILLATENRLLGMMLNGESLERILAVLCEEVEQTLRGAVAVLLLRSADGESLRMGAAPSLPEELRLAFEDMLNGPRIFPPGQYPGSTGTPLVREFADDPLWPQADGMFSAIGLGRTWTSPIVSRDTGVGILSLYFANAIDPSEADRQFLHRITQLAAIAIERSTSEESQRLITRVFESTQEGMIITDATNRILWVNPAFTQITGHTAAELIGRNTKIISNAQHDPVYQGMRDSLASTNHWTGERWNIRKDGSRYCELLSVTAIRNPEGKLTHYASSRSDITAQKLAEQERQYMNSTLQTLQQTSPDAILLVGEHERIVTYNRKFVDTFAIPEELVRAGQDAPVLAAFVANVADPGPFLARVKHLYEHQNEKSHDQFALKDGRLIDRYTSPVVSEQGNYYGRVWYFRDITERVKAEQALRANAAQLRLITDNLPVSITQVDLDHRILFSNRYSSRFSGREPAQELGQRMDDLLPPELRTKAINNFTQVFAGRTLNLHFSYPSPEGTPMTVSTTMIPARNEQGEITGCYILTLDITEQVQTDREIRALNEQLERRVQDRTVVLEAVVKELEAFSYSVSHDLRAPLRGIEGFMRIIEQKYADRLDDTGRDYLMRVRRNSVRMGELIDDMLALSQVTRGEFVHASVNLGELARDVIAEWRQIEPSRNVAVEIQEGMVVSGDRRLLRIALENLIGNAWKFTSRRFNAEIQMGTTPTPRGTAIFIRDNGAGFDMRYADKLFSSFQRLHTTTEFEGTGIGLAIVQRVIYRHGGIIWAEGAVDAGATIYFMVHPAIGPNS